MFCNNTFYRANLYIRSIRFLVLKFYGLEYKDWKHWKIYIHWNSSTEI